jgi:phosphoenolpyruvate---glycerone phosphotransferase subunit DhaL
VPAGAGHEPSEVVVTDSFDAVDLVVLTIAQTAVDNEKYFGDLDSVVGDGDFGYSMARGFEQVVAGFGDFDRTDIGTFLKRVAVTITGRIGGTSGPIWGTAFIRAGATAGDRTDLTGEDVVAMLRAAADGIMQRGGAELGEKTLLDALVPATDTLERELAAGTGAADALARTAVTARQAADATKEMVAKRGRAAYTGERSRGSVDAGATAVAVMLERISAAWAAKYTEEAS